MIAEEKLAAVLKALGDPTRLRLLKLLADRPNPLCVGALARNLGVSQPAVSQHLRVLKGLQIVDGRRIGVRVHYQINAPRLLACQAQIDQFLQRTVATDARPSGAPAPCQASRAPGS